MSKAYREKFGTKKATPKELREFLRPKFVYEPDGVRPIYITEQEHLKECDVNLIIKKYDKTKVLDHVANFEHFYGDMTGNDFREIVDQVQNCTRQFMELPSELRRRFYNSPEELLKFMEDPRNREEGIKLGLITADSLPSSDGFGEHVQKPSGATIVSPVTPHQGENTIVPPGAK